MAEIAWYLRLSPAQLKVVRTVIAGHTTPVEVGQQLGISERTVRTHLSSIYAKTGAANLTALVLMALGHKECAIDLIGQLEKAVR
jgi:DNA-binding CsgD family transcriptional regulator